MGSYVATLTPNTVATFTIPVPCYKLQATWSGSGTANTYITADGSTPVVPTNNTVTAGNQVCLEGQPGAVVQLRSPMPGSALGGPGPAGPAGTTLPVISMVSLGTPQIVLEW